MYIQYYDSPLGKILLAADEIGLIGVWFENQKYYADGLIDPVEKEMAVLKETKEWLNLYFSGKEPKVLPKMHLIGTKFQSKVWQLLLKIPYGKTMTYKDIARMISPSMSAQAVGSAVGHNKISILIPCHRVIGSNNSLTGYAGGIERKEYLEKLIAWKDKQLIKIVTGVRRCGKSMLLEIYRNYLKEHGIEEEQIISINFE